ncbi:Putative lysine arginine ornithine transport system kinase [Blastococcus saxobsidens DD2]|uniref:Putative lysine arginine ornithine transport system kinase n=1 Tax=Blastococcus saxobsidens (strain DD2) TaxID=1146883 RepID=H6RNL9_BLASD|nr:Putative lysine arginine ornithine transport system kinase [Blastococcus saxobsidens DD2]
MVSRARDGDVLALSRLLSVLEDTPEPSDFLDLVPALPEATVTIGLTGPPGAGKSTLTAALVECRRARSRRVAVLAVDPSSAATQGAVLGDRIRMTRLSEDDGVFVRSLAARGHLGGLAIRLPAAIRALAWAGFDEIIVETVGVGQSETAIADVVDTTVVVLSPGQGDSVQAAKAGILEIADIYAVNKADQSGADRVVRDLRSTILFASGTGPGEWRPPVVRTVASDSDVGRLDEHLSDHSTWLRDHGRLSERRVAFVRREVRGIVEGRLKQNLDAVLSEAGLRSVVERVAGHETPLTDALRLAESSLAVALASAAPAPRAGTGTPGDGGGSKA